MMLGKALIAGAFICGLLVLLGCLWIVRSIRTGEFSLVGPGLYPAIRRVRQPVKFWVAVATLAFSLTLPLAVTLFVLLQVFT